jgi:outer membrane protein OmpA-like peptidoglycan-associated protein
MGKLLIRGLFFFVIICFFGIHTGLKQIPEKIEHDCAQRIARFDGKAEISVEGLDVSIEGVTPSETARDSILAALERLPGLRNLKMSFKIHPDTLLNRHIRQLSREMILFEKNSAEIHVSAMALIDTVAHYLRTYPKFHLTLFGYSDATGDSLYNLTLSEKRAFAVQVALVARACDIERIKSRGHGVDDADQTSALSPIARRVEFQFKELKP